jgi:hypothetical protein
MIALISAGVKPLQPGMSENRQALFIARKADFEALHSRKHEDEVQLYAFDILALDGDDLRGLPLSMRKINRARL